MKNGADRAPGEPCYEDDVKALDGMDGIDNTNHLDDFHAVWQRYRARVETALAARLTAPRTPLRLQQAMTYATLGGGKRFRAMLVYAAGMAVGARLSWLDTPACAVEMMHAYSLIHDDLPAMDDDALRRGRATCHLAFDEATAILAGDALQARAIEILASNHWNPCPAERQVQMIAALTAAVGAAGMVGGQSLDMQAGAINRRALVKIHRLKTGALIAAAAVLGGLTAAHTTPQQLQSLRQYAAVVGLAFQITDDILDMNEDHTEMATDSSTDAATHSSAPYPPKATYTAFVSPTAARTEANRLATTAIAALQPDPDSTNPTARKHRRFLVQLARFAATRSD